MYHRDTIVIETVGNEMRHQAEGSQQEMNNWAHVTRSDVGAAGGPVDLATYRYTLNPTFTSISDVRIGLFRAMEPLIH